jgi:hypothetical protein
VNYFWDRSVKGGTCLDVNKLAYANGTMSMIRDVVVVLLPLPVVAKLNMSLQQGVEARGTDLRGLLKGKEMGG